MIYRCLISRINLSGEIALEAGALVLADQGLCVIDEFDKIGCDYRCLLEAMEQQQVSIAKSGVVTTLSSRCSIIAAANPTTGLYDGSKTVNENIKMSSALLSRFDLVFVILDTVDVENDQQLSRHIMKTHGICLEESFAREGETPSSRKSIRITNSSQNYRNRLKATHSYRQRKAENPMFEKTVGNSGIPSKERGNCGLCSLSERTPIPIFMLRQYIIYARTFVHPKLTGAAAMILQECYMKIRANSRLGDTLPSTMRQLESLIRLAQARARMELRETVRESDAQNVVQLMEYVS